MLLGYGFIWFNKDNNGLFVAKWKYNEAFQGCLLFAFSSWNVHYEHATSVL